MSATALVGWLLAAGLALVPLLRRKKRTPRRPREVVLVPWLEADRMLAANEGWRVAPEEDHSPSRALVYLERDMPEGSSKGVTGQ